jgi:hypothetical protein
MIRVATCIPNFQTRGVSHNGLAIYTRIKAKEEELWKLKYISLCKKKILKKIL